MHSTVTSSTRLPVSLIIPQWQHPLILLLWNHFRQFPPSRIPHSCGTTCIRRTDRNMHLLRPLGSPLLGPQGGYEGSMEAPLPFNTQHLSDSSYKSKRRGIRLRVLGIQSRDRELPSVPWAPEHHSADRETLS